VTRTEWHHTVWTRSVLILRESVIRPATPYVPKAETPLVWLSLRQHWEPTANKGTIEGAKRRGFTTQETLQRGHARAAQNARSSPRRLLAWLAGR